MRSRILRPLSAALFLALLPTLARGDVVDLSDGKRAPASAELATAWGEVPSVEDMRETSRQDLKLAYDEASLGRQKINPAEIVNWWSSEAYENASFNEGETHAASGFWREAAAAFRASAADLEGSAKQQALYKYMLAVRLTGDEDATLAAVDELLRSSSKTYYFAVAQETRARVYAARGDAAKAVEALDAVVNAPGMNARDKFNAAHFKVLLTQMIGASDPAQYKAAEDTMRALLTELERAPGREYAVAPRMKILSSIGAAQHGQGQLDKALATYRQVLGLATEHTNKGILASLYNGMGDVSFEQAAALQDEAGSDEAKKARVLELLNGAAKHYLRVLLLYAADADSREVFGATRGAALALHQIFTLGGEKDCDLARRAYTYYREATTMMAGGEARSALLAKGRALQARIKAVCQN